LDGNALVTADNYEYVLPPRPSSCNRFFVIGPRAAIPPQERTFLFFRAALFSKDRVSHALVPSRSFSNLGLLRLPPFRDPDADASSFFFSQDVSGFLPVRGGARKRGFFSCPPFQRDRTAFLSSSRSEVRRRDPLVRLRLHTYWFF